MSRQRRISAVVALLAAAGLLVAILVFLVNSGLHFVLGVAGLAVAALGAWWAITERGVRRGVGIGVGVLGVAALVSALVLAVVDSGAFVVHLFVAVALGVIAVVSARYALTPHLHELDLMHAPWRPRHPVLICNPKSGGGKVDRFELVEAAHRIGVETVVLGPDDDLEQLARDAVARGADCLGMAGGDGSQALVAAIAIEHDLPFVCVSAGTRNHFALDLGLDRSDPRRNVRAFTDGVIRRVDYATVNGRLFVNNVSLGVYATIVQQDSYRDDKTQTTAALLPELLGNTAEPFDLQFTSADGTAVDGAFLILVSNNPYSGALLDAGERRRMDTGLLGVVALSPRTGAEAATLVALSAVGLRKTSPHWHEFTTPTFEVCAASGTAYAGVDGEALELTTPLRFRSHHKGLRLLVPSDNPLAESRRRARDVSVRALVQIAAGRPPG